MICIFIFLIIFGLISPAYCADILLKKEDPFSRGEKSPPHPNVEGFLTLLQHSQRNDKSRQSENPYHSNSKSGSHDPLSLSEGISESPQFEHIRSFFEHISIVYDPYATLKLKLFCTQISNINPYLPNDAYMGPSDYALIQQIKHLKKAVTQVPITSLCYTDLNDQLLKDPNVSTLCKLTIYLAGHLDFSHISANTAPFQLYGLSPAQQRSYHYCNVMKRPWCAQSTPDDLEYYHSPKRSHTIWIANLLIAANQCLRKPEQSIKILKQFINALPNTAIDKKKSQKAYINTLIKQLQQVSRLPKADPKYLDEIYHDAITSEFLCEDGRCFVSRRLGYLTALLNRHSRCRCERQPGEHHAHSHDFIAKYLGLYQDSQ